MKTNKLTRLFFSFLMICSIALFAVGCSPKEAKQPTELTISAAASLKEVMAELTDMYTGENPDIKLTFNFGASGSLQQQIEQGAPSDLFISAGKKQMKALADKDLLVVDTNKDLVRNTLVLVGSKDTKVTSINDLTTDKVKKIAVGEPKSVPAGKYADEALTKLSLKDKVNSKLVFAKDVKEVFAWTSSGNADVGFVYASDALNKDNVKVIETVKEDSHSPIMYPIAVIKASKNVDAAKAFEEFLLGEKAQKIFEKYGYKSAN
ncbi:molybdate ABC transporter substrate-binding protein [Clostridium sp.]|uniref:molybdate ABC transporter substrate-binding protein n=1 Tax=Clostridium sp. TaxID=1506 RepID=UPI003FA551A1